MAKHPRTGTEKAPLTATQLLAAAETAMDSGDTRLAARNLAEALSVAPHNSEIHLALGNFHLKIGKANDAESFFKSALGFGPDSVEAAVGLVKVRVATGRFAEAEAMCRDLIAQFPEDLIPGQVLAQILVDQNRTTEVVSLLRSLVEAHPDAVAPLNSLGKRLAEQGEFSESRTCFERALIVDKSNALAYLGWVQTKTVAVEDKPMVRAMEGACSSRSLPEVERMQLLFALGKAHGDLGNFEMSMDFYRQGNEIRDALSQKTQPFNRDRILDTLDLTRQIFTKANIEFRQSDYHSVTTPIFIFGMFRAGTTLVEQVLSNHTSVVAGGEIPYWMGVSAECFDRSRRTFDFDRAKALRRQYQLKLNSLASGAKYVTDKMPGNYRILGLLRILFPGAKFIHCTRHPVDTCLSIYMTPFNTPPNYASDPGKLIFNYEVYRQTMNHWQETLGQSDIHEVRYEELIERSGEEIPKLLSFCELEFEQACLSPESNQRSITTASTWQVRQPIYRSSVEKWRQYEPWLGEFRKLLD